MRFIVNICSAVWHQGFLRSFTAVRLGWLGGCIALLLTSGCTGVPDGVSVVKGFELNRYLGTWYEIARLDHSFERGLSDVSASYSMRADGGVRVLNRGFDTESGEWKLAEGRAYFTGAADEGSLKVSFFGPFYGGYNVIALERENYSYSLVSGPDLDYLWILSREKQLAQGVKDELLALAAQYGFATEDLIWVSHTRTDPQL